MNMGVTNADELRQLAVMPGWLHGRTKDEIITEFSFALLRGGLDLRILLDTSDSGVACTRHGWEAIHVFP